MRAVLLEMNAFLKERGLHETRWGPKQDRHLIEHYGKRPTRELSLEMTAKFKRPYTRNALISRYNKLRRSGDIERYRTDPTYRARTYIAPAGSR